MKFRELDCGVDDFKILFFFFLNSGEENNFFSIAVSAGERRLVLKKRS